MQKHLLFLFQSLFGIALICHPAKAQVDIKKSDEEIVVVDQKIMMPMRDGIRLATDIYRPNTDQPVPVIFSKTVSPNPRTLEISDPY